MTCRSNSPFCRISLASSVSRLDSLWIEYTYGWLVALSIKYYSSNLPGTVLWGGAERHEWFGEYRCHPTRVRVALDWPSEHYKCFRPAAVAILKFEHIFLINFALCSIKGIRRDYNFSIFV